MTGKWDAGMATWDHTPMGRGYETFFGYYHHANDYYNETLSAGSTVHKDPCPGRSGVDLWNTTGPAYGKNGTIYEEEMFKQNTLEVLDKHDPSEPLFMFHSFHVIHSPLQVPEDYEKKFDFLKNDDHRKYSAMVYFMDEAIGMFVDKLKAKGMWDNTLMVVSSDNGGPIYGTDLAFGSFHKCRPHSWCRKQ
jgi:arylsulfatase I/J